MRCDDPNCPCQPAFSTTPRKVEAVLHGATPNEVTELHQPGAQLDVIFDLIENALILRETIPNPTKPNTSSSFSVQINYAKMRFVNLRALDDGSIVLTFRMRRSACIARGKKVLVKEKFHGFAPHYLTSRLEHGFYGCGWSRQNIQLLMPVERIKGLRTVALILKTFKEITAEQWCSMVHMANPPSIVGLDWNELKKVIFDEPKSKPKLTCPTIHEDDEEGWYGVT